MSEHTAILRSVGSLLKESFFVPKYQRGYRWVEKQVTDLLEDVKAFKPITMNMAKQHGIASSRLWYVKTKRKINII
ncbi:MAG: DUF262 domain-containing protein [Treponema sp.]|nr:DUF262 domain-containing protein [Treponema sp.]